MTSAADSSRKPWKASLLNLFFSVFVSLAPVLVYLPFIAVVGFFGAIAWWSHTTKNDDAHQRAKTEFGQRMSFNSQVAILNDETEWIGWAAKP